MVLPLQTVHVVILGNEELFEKGKSSVKNIWLDKDKMTLEIVYGEGFNWDSTIIFLSKVERIDYKESKDNETKNIN